MPKKYSATLNGSCVSTQLAQSTLGLVTGIPDVSDHLFLDVLLTQLQLQLSYWLRDTNNDLNQLSKQDRSVIQTLSMAMKLLIQRKHLPVTRDQDESPVTAVLTFSKQLTLRQQLDIEAALTGLLLARGVPPEQHQPIKQLLDQSRLHVLDLRAIQILRATWAGVRENALDGEMTELSKLTELLLNKFELGIYVREAIQSIREKARHLNRFHADASKQLCELANQLDSHATAYFSRELTLTAFTRSCEVTIQTLEHRMAKQRGFYGVVGTFYSTVGKLLGVSTWIKQGGACHAREIDSTRRLHRFFSPVSPMLEKNSSDNPRNSN